MPSSSLIPSGDPTLLLTNSGMAQFKAYFSGEKAPPQKRITTAQKCFRTTDIEEVGDDTHLTLFEMLGNFSFGDYFKKEACEWALEFMVDILGFEKDRLFFTIYKDDDESKSIWLDLGIEEKYIYKFGDEDNWWGPAGDEGPCGPCSELHYYQGDKNNMEFDNPKVLTVRPVDVEKFSFVDYDNDGVAEQQTYSYEVMWERSGLAMFDENQDGLAPNEFVGQSFLEMDDNDDKAIDLQEWREAYIMSRAPANAEQERYQD